MNCLRACKAMTTACLVAALMSALFANAQSRSSDLLVATFFKRLAEEPDNYARLRYADARRVSRDPVLRNAANQVYATMLAAFGRPGEAISHFPSNAPRLPGELLPTPASHQAAPAVDTILHAVAAERVVMVNEAHHRPQTRLLTLALLPGMRKLGFTHFAVEGLDPADTTLASRSYPTEKSGFYIGEPIYGDIVRDALRLGFKVVPYEAVGPDSLTPQDRETKQAQALTAVLAADVDARVFVHAGFAHVDKAPGQLGGARPMAVELKRLSGIAPFTIDQTILLHDAGASSSAYRALDAAFRFAGASVLVSRTGELWSFRPRYHDVTVLLPHATDSAGRPEWLSLDGARKRWTADVRACRNRFPCLFEARYAGEADAAIPADQLAVFGPNEVDPVLYLRPGRYELRIRDHTGKTTASQTLTIRADR